MAHELSIRADGFVEMAFVGDIPWHGLGQTLTPDSNIEEWKTQAGMDWIILREKVKFQDPNGNLLPYEGKNVLYRSDTMAPLSIVSEDYKVVQPGEVLEFFQDLVGPAGMQLETAGVLFGGRRFWAMANTNRFGVVNKKDTIKGNLLLTTACDGTLATTAMFTAVRTVCNNTLRLALDAGGEKFKVTHAKAFDPKQLKNRLDLLDNAWENFMDNVKSLSKIKVSDKDARAFYYDLVADPDLLAEEQSRSVEKKIDEMFSLYAKGMGSDLSYGNAFGLLNGVTEYANYNGRASGDAKIWDSFHGDRAKLAERAYGSLVERLLEAA